MAAIDLALVAECELLYDAIDTLQHIHEALTKRHGEAFRALGRRIEALADEPNYGEMGHADLEPGRVVLFAPTLLAKIIADARALGVIR